jgi:hypothetical protein
LSDIDPSYPQVETSVDNLKVLSVRQPWASAIFFEGPAAKTIENRPWFTTYRGRIGIHASRRIDLVGMEFLNIKTMIPERDRGVLLGTVELLEVHQARSASCNYVGCAEDPWAQFPLDGARVYHWEIGHARRFVTPIPASGRLGLWESGPSLNHLADLADVVTVLP